MKLIDLSVPLNENTPVYPGDPTPKINPAGIFDQHGYEDHVVCVGTHVGTHMDAPRHMIKNGMSLDQFEINSFVGRGTLIKVENNKFDLNKIKKLSINAGDIVLFYTGMSDVYTKPEYYEKYPAIPEEVANYIVSKKVKMVGVDMCSPDHEPFPIHKILLSNKILIIENLTNLSQLEGKNFKVYALPIRLQIDGAPTRAVAEILA